MLVDGNQIAEEIYSELENEVSHMKAAPRLVVFTCDPNFETKKFLGIKKRVAERVGVNIEVVAFPSDVTTDYCVQIVRDAAEVSDGIIVQLPFPEHVDIKTVLHALPVTHDVDAFNIKDNVVVPPVLGAVQEVCKVHNIDVAGKRCVVIGAGRLVGVPVADWISKSGGDVTVMTAKDSNLKDATVGADIIVLGAGSPGMLIPDMITEGAVIIDAGTSETAGELKGDADPLCAEKALLFTPVPGGIGPITVAILFRNLLVLTSRQ